MKPQIIIFFLFSIVTNAQVDFQKGYIIDNSKNKFECLIKNNDWKRSPTYLTYKLSDSSSEETLLFNQLKEFRILGTDNFFKRYTISKNIVGSFYEEMQLESDSVLLRVLVDGHVDLLEFHNNGRYYFFYESEDELVFLDYKKTVDENNIVRENAKFKRQLFDNFKCKEFTVKDYSSLRYNSTNLSDFFSEYNICSGSDYINLHSKRTKPKLRLKVRGGMNLNSSLINNNANSYVLSYTIPPFSGNPEGEDVVKTFEGVEDYKVKNNFFFGIEFEARLPFGQNNWSVFLSPAYHSVSKIEGKESFSEPNVTNAEVFSSLSYSFMQVPVGIRHYFDVSGNLEIYVHLSYSQNFVLASDYSTQINDVATSSRPYSLVSRANRGKKSNSGGSFGIGLTFLEKYALDINYYSLGLSLSGDYQVNMRGFAINASVTIF